MFGFHDAVASRQRYDIRLSETYPLLVPFTEPRERHLRVGIREKGLEVLGTYGYTECATPLALFEDGTAAITQKAYGCGRPMPLGWISAFCSSRATTVERTRSFRSTTISSTPHSMSGCGLSIRARGG